VAEKGQAAVLCAFVVDIQPDTHRERIEALAARQGGRIARYQLTALGLPRGVVRTWERNRTLIATLPGVSALGYVRTDRTARAWDAILYAGPGAGLTGAGAAYELGLLLYEPGEVKVASPWHRRPSRPECTVLARRQFDREVHDGIPYVSIADLLLELAAEANVPILRRALETLDFRRMLDLAAAHHACGKGRRGSVLLTDALAHRLPELARTKSDLEVHFLLLLEALHLPIPRVNEKLHGVEPDMYWPQLRLVVELDGDGNHHSAAQKRRDARKDRLLRSRGLTVIRLTHHDVHHDQAATLMTLAGQGLMNLHP
jgi:very-short-patch-repair endonuclease